MLNPDFLLTIQRCNLQNIFDGSKTITDKN